jgi:hypothetical protein
VREGVIFSEIKKGYIHNINNLEYVGLPKSCVENSGWFEEIKEPKMYWYINDRLEVICETWPDEEIINNLLYGRAEYENPGNQYKWQRIKAGNCFNDEDTAKQIRDSVHRVMNNYKPQLYRNFPI